MNDTLEYVPLTQLRHYYNNPRKGNIELVADSIIENGQYKPLVVNRGTSTGRPYEVLAGNHTLMALQKLGVNETPCYMIDVDDERAAKIVLVDNRASDVATYNDQALLDMLQDLDTLTGTGYDSTNVQELIDLLAIAEEEHTEEGEASPYDDFIKIQLALPPQLAAQWLQFTGGFGCDEEALEYLLDHVAVV